jgi:hypothetical protein
MTDLGQSGGRDMEPLAERPGYNASPTDWVRYANHLENALDWERQQRGKEVLAQMTRAEIAERERDEAYEDARRSLDRVNRLVGPTEPPTRQELFNDG